MSRFPLLVLATVAFTAAAAAGQTYTDEQYGYQIKPLAKWDAVPPRPTDKHLVAKWTSPREIRDLPAELRVYVFHRGAAGGYGNGDDDIERPAGLLELQKRLGRKSSYTAFMKTDRARIKTKLGKPRKLRIKGPKNRKPETALLFKGTRPSYMRRGSTTLPDYMVLVGVIRTKNWEYAIEGFCSVKAERKMLGALKSAIRSFKLLKAPTLGETSAVASTDRKGGYERTGKSEKERTLEKVRKEVARTKGWWAHESKRYVILTNVEKKQKIFIKDIARRLEAVRDRYEQDFPSAKPISAVSVVRVCKDRKTYSSYGGPSGSAGYWYSPAEELVFFREGNEDKPFKVLNHEAFHQYIFYACGKLSPHSWYNEGYGDYYAGAKIIGTKVRKIEPFLWRRDTIRQAARDGSYVPIKDIIRWPKSKYYANPQLCYAEGWSIVYFLNTGLAKGHPWEEILPTYLRVIQATKDKNKAVDAAFEGVDLDQFEAAWKAYTTRGTKAKKPRKK